MLRLASITVWAALLGQAFFSPTQAINRSWDSGGANENWSLTNNWSPNGDPGGDDLSIGNILQGFNAATIVNLDYTVDSLAVSNGASVDTDGNRLIVQGPTSLATGSNSTLLLRERTSGGVLFPQSLITDSLFVGSDSTVEMYDDSVLEVDNGVFNLFGRLQGNGELQVSDIVGSPTTLFNNSGTLSVGLPGISISPPARTLRITRSTPNARIDLDGNGFGEVFLQQNATLDIDVQISEAFSGVMSLGPNSTLDVADAWSVDGEVNVNTSNFFLTAPASITGGQLTLDSGAVVTLDETDEELHFNTTLSANNGSTLANSGTVVFNAPAQFGATANFDLIGSHGSMVINSQSVTIVQDSFDIDGSGQTTNQVTVNAGAQFIFDGGDFGAGDLKADGVMNINAGEMVMDPFGNWTMDGTLNMNGTATNEATLRNQSGTTTSSNVFIGDGLGSSDANVVVAGSSESRILYRSVRLRTDADIDIAAGAVLSLGSLVVYEGENATYDGEGTLYPGLMLVTENTTLDIATVDLDHSVTPGGISQHTINAPLTINADAIDSDDDGFDGELTVFHNENDPGILAINTAGGWNFTSGTLELKENASPGVIYLFPPVLLAGDRVFIDTNATLDTSGLVAVRAPLTIAGTLSVAEDLFLGPANAVDTLQRIEGGAINGAGTIRLNPSAPLTGFGSISAELFSSTSVYADDGLLTITGDIIGLDLLGVTEDGTLFFPNFWSTAPINNGVVLEGGTILGATVTNTVFAGIRGHGEINAAIDNDSVIRAEGGGTLIVGPGIADSDYDGSGGAGDLRAVSANLVLRNQAEVETFESNAFVSPGQEIFVDDFIMNFSSSSRLTVDEGIYRTNRGVAFGGEVIVNGSTPSRLVNTGSLSIIFSSTSDVVLNANLELESPSTAIGTGATFSGPQNLVNLENSALRLQQGVDLDVAIVNHGLMTNGTLSDIDDASATVSAFTQSNTGELQVDLAGVAPGTFDVLTVDNNAILDGTISVNLISSFVPVLGNSFTFLETTFGNVGGMFAFEDLPHFNGLTLDVVYNPQSVVLEVVESADVDGDGDVDGADFLMIQRTDPSLIPLWESQYPGAPGLGATQAVPEPTGISLIVMALLACSVHGIRRRFC